MPKDKETGLTGKQMLFCREYAISLNATEAAIKAGYSKGSAGEVGCENLKKSNIQAYLKTLQADRNEKLQVNAEWVLKRFIEIANRCMAIEPVMKKDKNGNMVESGTYQFDSAGANRAAENIAKHVGFFEKDNQQQNLIISPNIILKK